MPIKIYRIPSSAYTQIRQVVGQDHFARNGYTLRQGRGLGLDIDDYFLYINAPDEFFAEHEKEILVGDVSEVTGNEYDNVKKAVEAEEESVAAGIGLFE